MKDEYVVMKGTIFKGVFSGVEGFCGGSSISLRVVRKRDLE